ncbi:MAG: prepilin-type cleavage/methylation domain-containing protein [Deltaproteobacteria bacterium]|nr:prepilin-type cleavage/methylation domain-containing protein [Deltaproteobacteria bacterium]
MREALGVGRDRSQRHKIRGRGFSLAELLLAIATLGTIIGVAVPAYRDYLERAKVTKAITDIRTFEKAIQAYETDNDTLPNSLSDIGQASVPDPWGNPYVYLNISTAKNPGALRKDRFLVPLNSDYDLYSKGADGRSRPPLTARDSWDDIIRANDGGYVGLASDY